MAARPFDLVINTSWPLVAGNSFDAQHFAVTHDRQMLGASRVSNPHPYARRFECDFEVLKTSLRDRVARAINGDRVRLQVTCWGGGTLLVVASLRSTTSYGYLSLLPISSTMTRIRVIVWVPRSRSVLGRVVLDPLDAAIRRWFIRAFAANDVRSLAGTSISPARMIDEDRTLVEFLDWLRPVSWGLSRDHTHAEVQAR